MVRYLPLGSIIAVLLYVSGVALKSSASADIAKLDDAIKPIIIGRVDAPVTIVEYASLGCSHCAKFHTETYPKLKKEYIETGKVKLLFRDFPLGTPALAASMIARCAGPSRYLGFVNIFFRSQKDWSQANDPLGALKKVARFGGLSGDDVDQCLRQQKLIDHLQEIARKANSKHGINSTPSFLINDKKISGALEYKEFRALIEKALELRE
ncbi:MAG: hypothetical protein CMF69_11840 [Magnetovibrio sp.]|nr:hypothetical protein [Magnetovibrio sp.]